MINKNNINIILIEEDFANADIEKLIESIKKEAPNTKIIVIGEKEVSNADSIIKSLNLEEIKNELKKVSE